MIIFAPTLTPFYTSSKSSFYVVSNVPEFIFYNSLSEINIIKCKSNVILSMELIPLTHIENDVEINNPRLWVFAYGKQGCELGINTQAQTWKDWTEGI